MTRAPRPVAVALMACAVLSLKWPFRVTTDALFAGGRVDVTTAGYLATFGMILVGLPGLALTLFSDVTRGSRGARIAVTWSLLALLTGSLGCLLWIGVSVRAVGTTLSPFQIAVGVLPPAVTALVAVWSRVRLRSEGRDIDL